MRCTILHPIWLAFWLACGVWLSACAAGPAPPAVDDGPRDHAVQVIGDGWHTAIVVPRAEVVATGLVPEAAHLPGAAFLEFGWGDRDYYPARRPTTAMTLRAALLPTPAVIHMAGRARAPQPGGDLEVVRVALTEAGFRAMLRAIGDTFERGDGAPAEPVARGRRPQSHFYAARGRFHLFNTCNTWTVRMLRAGGVEVSPAGVITGDDAMARLRAAIAARRRLRRPGLAPLRATPLRAASCPPVRRRRPRSGRGRGQAGRA